jgi:hypothetical protein
LDVDLMPMVLSAEERSEGDCLRVAVAQAYGGVHDFGYHDTPADDQNGTDPTGQQQRWEAWSLERGLRWWTSFELAPVQMAAWIGQVDSRTHPGALHAIPFHHEQPILPEPTTFADVSIDDVRDARWLLPAGVAMPAGRLRRIVRPEPGRPVGIFWQVEIEGMGGTTWRRAELGTSQGAPGPNRAERRAGRNRRR